MDKPSFLIYKNNWPALKDLTDAELGAVMRQLFEYACNGIEPENPIMAFNFLRIQVDMDSDKYASVCKKRQEAIQKRWEQKNTNVYKCIQENTSDTDKDMDKDMGMVMDKEKDMDTSNDVEIYRDNAPSGAALAFDFRRQLIKDGTDAQVAADFMRCRKAKRLANTRTAYDQMRREAEKAGMSIAEAARVCAENSWGGFKAEYLEQRRSATVHQPTHNEVLDAQIRDWRESTARLNEMFGPQPEPYQDHYITEQYDQDQLI